MTTEDEMRLEKQVENFQKMQSSVERYGVTFTWDFDPTIHARSIETDMGWKISLDRGLDIYQQIDDDVFSMAMRMQDFRPCKPFEITYIKV